MTESNIARDLDGERVTETYLDKRTGESCLVDKNSPVPDGLIPVLGTIS